MADQFIIPVHSFVDIITNSSTVIYTGITDDGVQAIRDIVDHVLREAGRTDLVADDLYNIEVYNIDEKRDKIDEILEAQGMSYNDAGYWDKWEELDSEIQKKAIDQVKTDIGSGDASTYTKSCIIVTPKRNKTDDIFTRALSKIFSVYESYE